MDRPHHEPMTRVALELNGEAIERRVPSRMLLTDFLRAEGLTGTHVACEQGVCGACTIHLDGEPVRACLMLAAQATGHRVATVESLAGAEAELTPLQAAFRRTHGLQCGFCTPGFLMSIEPVLAEWTERRERPTRGEIRVAVSGNICRCTGYDGIVDAVELALDEALAG